MGVMATLSGYVPSTLAGLPPDARLLFVARGTRLFAYGLLAVVLSLYLTTDFMYSDVMVGELYTGTLIGDAVISLLLTSVADRVGRKRTLMIGAGLMALAGVGFATARSFWALLFFAVVGVVSPGGPCATVRMGPVGRRPRHGCHGR